MCEKNLHFPDEQALIKCTLEEEEVAAAVVVNDDDGGKYGIKKIKCPINLHIWWRGGT